jgi:hypothetical protein
MALPVAGREGSPEEGSSAYLVRALERIFATWQAANKSFSAATFSTPYKKKYCK